MRGIEERIAWYQKNRPAAANRCAEYLWRSLGGPTDPPRQGLPDATAVAKAVPDGKMQSGPAPRGAIVYWVGGADGHGHCAYALGDRTELSVDVNGPRTVGIKPFTWFAKNWPKLKYVGWSWYWGKYDTEPMTTPELPTTGDGKLTVGGTIRWWRDYSGKPDGVQTVPADNKWHKVQGIDVAAAPFPGREDHFFYSRLRPRGWDNSDAMLHAECRWLRDGGTPGDATDDDPTAIKELHFEHGTMSVPFDQKHMEEGEAGVGGSWWVRFSGGLTHVDLDTRYAKTYVLSVTE